MTTSTKSEPIPGIREVDSVSENALVRTAAVSTDVAARHADTVDREARFPHETIDALRDAGLLSIAVPKRLGGGGADLATLAAICETLGRGCASSAMIFAMHAIQVESIVHHCSAVPELEDYLRALVREQRLIASGTSEAGTGGELRRSIACLEPDGEGGFQLEKSVTVCSYGEQADDLLVSARRDADAASGDQVLALLCGGDYVLEDVGRWDTLGMRGTCSPPVRIVGHGAHWQVLPEPFRDIAPATMVPVSHVLWASVWLGIASDAQDRARRFVQIRSRKDPDGSAVAAQRLVSLTARRNSLRAQVSDTIGRYSSRRRGDAERASDLGAVLEVNDLKLAASEAVVDIVTEALRVIGIAGYQSEGEFALGRPLRDAHSAALMINNDRIRSTNADLLMIYKGR